MRKHNVVVNTLAAVFSYLLLFGLNIFVRKLFLRYFSLEFLGYEGLFSSIFAVLSIAELGAGGMFNYMLYEALAKNDMSEISVIMGMYQKLYRIIGTAVLLIGGILFFALPLLIQSGVDNWEYVKTIYLIQLASTLVTYFLAYRRALLIADQRSSHVVRIETIYSSIGRLLQMAAIVILHSYTVYLLVLLLTNFLASIHVAKHSKMMYPKAFGHKSSWKDFKDRQALSQLRELLISKISTTIFTSTDNILITAITGVQNVALFSNYQQINWGIMHINSFFVEAVERSTGSFVYTESDKRKRDFFSALDFFAFAWGTTLMSGFLCVFERVIRLIYGSEYLMAHGVVIALAIGVYVRCRGIAYNAFRGAVGHYELSRWFSVASAVINLVLSFLWGQKWGVTGILMATAIGDMFIEAGRAYVMIKVILPQSIKNAILKEIFYFGIAIGVSAFSYSVTNRLSQDWLGFFLGGLGSVIVSVGVFCLVFGKSHRFKLLIDYVKETLMQNRT